jgi:hypothetical protein
MTTYGPLSPGGGRDAGGATRPPAVVGCLYGLGRAVPIAVCRAHTLRYGSRAAGAAGPTGVGRSGMLFVFWKPAISQRRPTFVKTKV